MLEEYQDRTPVTIIRIEAADPDIDSDMGSLPGCIGFHNHPEPGYVCSTCCHQTLCKETTPALFRAGVLTSKPPTSQRTGHGKPQRQPAAAITRELKS